MTLKGCFFDLTLRRFEGLGNCGFGQARKNAPVTGEAIQANMVQSGVHPAKFVPKPFQFDVTTHRMSTSPEARNFECA